MLVGRAVAPTQKGGEADDDGPGDRPGAPGLQRPARVGERGRARSVRGDAPRSGAERRALRPRRRDGRHEPELQRRHERLLQGEAQRHEHQGAARRAGPPVPPDRPERNERLEQQPRVRAPRPLELARRAQRLRDQPSRVRLLSAARAARSPPSRRRRGTSSRSTCSSSTSSASSITTARTAISSRPPSRATGRASRSTTTRTSRTRSSIAATAISPTVRARA
jgi:hypothetical protein